MTLTLRDPDVDRLTAVRAQRTVANLNSAMDAARRLLNTVDDPDVRRLAESFLARQQLAHYRAETPRRSNHVCGDQATYSVGSTSKCLPWADAAPHGFRDS